MACVLTQGYTLDCRESMGGIKAMWLIAHTNVSSVTEASGIVSGITKGAGKVFYKYELVKNTGSITETVTASVENGSVFYAQELSVVLNKLQANTRNEILLLAKNTLMVVVQDANDKYWLLGRYTGLDLTGGTAATGTALGDRNGYTLTFSGGEKELAPEVDSSIIAGLVS
jgi:hypothetical protein